LQITIHLRNINNNAPVFAHEMYRATVVENTPVLSTVTQVSATDADNDNVTYRIDGPSDMGKKMKTKNCKLFTILIFTDAFQINPTTGELSPRRELFNMARMQPYDLIVTATDRMYAHNLIDY
jgi:hypothetical protein